MEPIAVIGISCVFANGIDSPHSLWNALRDSIDVGSEIPKEYMDLTSFSTALFNFHPTLKDKLIRGGYFLESGMLDQFDSEFFGLSEIEARAIDPAHRLLLQKFVHLCEDANMTLDQINDTKTSVYIGQYSDAHKETIAVQPIETFSALTATNHRRFNASARLAYQFNLHGPNATLDAACSSSLQAVHLAVQSLRNGEADYAVAGGTNTNYRPEDLVHGSLLQALSPDGRSRSYCAEAKGYAKGEGTALVLLQRLSDAVDNGNQIYCVIRDVLSNHDGRCEDKISYTIPSFSGQLLLLQEIYARNQIDLSDVFYIEGHGTGTQAGDPIEANVLGKFFNRTKLDPPLLLGSIKSNIGHTEGTAGVAGLSKVALSMKYRMIPPQMNFKMINPKIKAEEHNLHIVQNLTKFPSSSNNHPVLIGINSFGVGGNNCHAIIQEYNCSDEDKIIKTNTYHSNETYHHQQCYLIVFSAKCHQSLIYQIEKFSQWYKSHSTSNDTKSFLAGLCHKLLLQRTTSFSHRMSFIFNNNDELQHQLDSFLSTTIPSTNITGVVMRKFEEAIKDQNICFVYSGQGPQWWKMGRDLYESEPVFRQWIDKISKALEEETDDWCLVKELIQTTDEKFSRINDTNVAQSSIFALQVALTALWLSWGIRPKIIVGHSMGEVTAAYVCGRMTLKEAVKVIYHRSHLQHRNTRQGGRMLALVGLNEYETNLLLEGIEDKVSIAAINSPMSLVLSGDSNILEELYEILTEKKPNVFKTWLRIENAFHSHQMERFNIHQDLLKSLRDIRGTDLIDNTNLFNEDCSTAKLYSTTTGNCVEKNLSLDAKYWWKNVRQPVRFSEAIQNILQDQLCRTQVFLEISPHPVLVNSIQECFTYSKLPSMPSILHSLKRKENEQQTMLGALCQLQFVDWRMFYQTRIWSKLPTDKLIISQLEQLPLYPFNNQTCWFESVDSVIKRRAIQEIHHPLLGVRQWTIENKFAVWKNYLNLELDQFSYLKDHRLQGQILFPATGFIELVVAAINEMQQQDEQIEQITLENFKINSALPLKCDDETNEITEIHTIINILCQQFLIYSRRHRSHSSLHSSNRVQGIASNDLVEDYSNEYLLDNYHSNEWILHVQGLIRYTHSKTDQSMVINTMYNPATLHETINSHLASYNGSRARSLYNFLNHRGYNYGPYFKSVNTFHITGDKCYSNLCVSDLFSKRHLEDYYLHPAITDACLQTAVCCITDYRTVVPMAARKILIRNKKQLITDQVLIQATMKPIIRGIGNNSNYTFDFILLDQITNEIIMIWEDLEVKSSLFTDTTSSEETQWNLFEKIEQTTIFPSSSTTRSMLADELENKYTLKTCWKQINSKHRITNEILPKANDLLQDTGVNSTEQNLIDQQRSEAMSYLDKLALIHIKLQLKQMVAVNIGSIEQSDFTVEKLRSLVALPHFHLLLDSFLEHGVFDNNEHLSQHQINLYELEFLKRFPLMRPLINLISTCGTHLQEILTGKLDPLQLIFNEENKDLLREFYRFHTETHSKRVFTALTEQLKIKLEQNKRTNDIQQTLTILEVGAGTGAATFAALEILLDFANSTETRVEYTFTDVSRAFFQAAQQQFDSLLKEKNTKQLLHVVYLIYDIAGQQATPEFEPESFDLIFASVALHVATDIVQSISRLRQLLVPNGLIILIESTSSTVFYDLIFGVLPQWWKTAATTQNVTMPKFSSRAIMNIKQWNEAFQLAGGFKASLDYISHSSSKESIIVAQKQSTAELSSVKQEDTWIIFSNKHDKSIGIELGIKLRNIYLVKNIIVVYLKEKAHGAIRNSFKQFVITNLDNDMKLVLTDISLSTVVTSTVNIVYCWSFDLDSTNITDETICTAFLSILNTATAVFSMEPHIFVLTHNAQTNLAQSALIGFTRTSIQEYKRNYLKLIDLEYEESSSFNAKLIDELLKELCTSTNDHEITLKQNYEKDTVERWLPFYERIAVTFTAEGKSTTKVIVPVHNPDSIRFYFEVPKSRFLSDLKWIVETHSIINTIPSTSVEVEIHCIGINFRDVLKARGLYPNIQSAITDYEEQEGNSKDEGIGSDFSGIITRVGDKVSSLHIGDRIIGFTYQSGCFKSHIILDETLVIRVPSPSLVCDELTMEELSSIPSPFLTVLYALRHRSNLTANQTILIHTASGAVGLAAIQYCQLIGAQIIATAGTEEKRQFLREKCHIQHVFNSRDLSFVDEIRKLKSDGVDVILNTLSGMFLQESMKLLSPLGHFIELGKRDIYSESNLNMFQLRNDCSFHVVDLVTFSNTRPDLIHNLLKEILNMINEKMLKPISPLNVFEASEIEEAFTLYNKATHIGKLVVRIGSSSKELLLHEDKLHSQNKKLFSDSVCNHGTVLVAGGFGGLGIEMTKWMIEKRKVKRIVLLSRRSIEKIKENTEDSKVWDNLERIASEQNAVVKFEQVDITKRDEIIHLFEKMNKTEYPIRGILHMAMVLHDCRIKNMTSDILTKSMRPKVHGAWFLHQSSLETNTPIEFFIMFSSIRNHVNDLGSANYNAGNHFLDSLASYRQQLHLPALSISIPWMLGTGYVHRNSHLLKNILGFGGYKFIPTQYLFELIERYQQHQTETACPILFTVDWNILHSKRGEYPIRLQNLIEEESSGTRQEETRATNDENTMKSIKVVDIDTLEMEIRRTIAKLFGSSDIEKIDLNRSLIRQGLDSLIAVSLSNWLTQQYSLVHLSVAELLQGLSIKEIAQKIHSEVKSRDCGNDRRLKNNTMDTTNANSQTNQTITNTLPKLIQLPESERYKPFPLTEIQQAYFIGRQNNYELGQVSAYIYNEYDCAKDMFNMEQFEQALNIIIQRHETLRTQFFNEMEQQILKSVPYYTIKTVDLSFLGDNETRIQNELNNRRQLLSHKILPTNQWPLFDIQATEWKTNIRLHIGFDGLILDAWSIILCLNEISSLYKDPNIKLPSLELSIRDYILTLEMIKQTASVTLDQDKHYWMQRSDTFPRTGPLLPLRQLPNEIKHQRFQRVIQTLDVALWQTISTNLRKRQITPVSLLVTLYASVLNKYTDHNREEEGHFAINLPLFSRLPIHQQVKLLIGDFTSILLLEIDFAKYEKSHFGNIVQHIQTQLWKDLEHTAYSGLRFQRELMKKTHTNHPITFPVVFTSVIGISNVVTDLTTEHNLLSNYLNGQAVYSLTQTPQVWIDYRGGENELGELVVEWHYVTDLFPTQMIQSMHYAYCNLLKELAINFNKIWQKPLEISLPPEQLHRRYLFEQTEWKNDNQLLLPRLVLEQAKARPHSMAVISSRGNLTYEQLRHRSTTISAQIRQKLEASSQTKPHLCAIIMEKGWEQVVASLSTLMAGYAFLPLDVQWPIERLNMLIEESECQIILTQIEYEDLVAKLQFKDVEIIVIKDDQNNEQNERELTFNIQQTSDLAYVIYTSGSTGKPKGVCITHEAVLNTLLDINDRLNITSDDRILALSHLNFDLSIYDIFGILIAGGTMIIPSQQDYKNPEAWHQLILEHNITLWNSVPMLMQMYVEYLSSLLRCLNPLRHILLSGDWIPLSLPRQIFDLLGNTLQLFSLGGASEASIWSIIYPIIENKIDQQWKSIPYGQPLRNQQYYILDSQLQPCPDYVCGDLYIGGKGLAIGYWKDKEKTKGSFIEHPLTKQIIYRTGDLGRFIPTEDGSYIEFLGRKDFQVKIGGHRIELGEIEYHLQQYPTIQQAIIDITPEEVKNKQLVAYIVQKPVMDMNLDEDIIKDSIERANFKLQRHGLLENQDFIFSFNQCISLSKKELSEKDIETIDARKSYRQFFNEDQLITTNEIQQLLNTCSQSHNGNVSTHKLFDFNTLSDILQCLTTLIRIVDQPLPKYRYPSAGSLYPVQTYVEIHSLENIDSGIYYHHPDKHTLLKVVEIDRLSNEDQSIHLHLVGRHQAIAPLYGSKTAKEFCLLESGYIYGLLKEVCLNNNLQVSISEKKNDDKKVHKLLQLSDDDTLCSLTIQYASNQSTLPSISLLTICDLYVYFKETNQWFIYKEDSASLELCGTFQVNNVELSENGRIFDHCAVALYICGDKYDEKQELIEIGMISQLLMDKAIESPINIGACPIGGGHLINHVNKLISSKIKNHRKHVLHTLLLGRVSSEQKKSQASSKVGNVNENQILTKYLKGKLPDYMIPNYYIMLEHLPLSSNGKIDRIQLFEIYLNRSKNVGYEDESVVEPKTEFEQMVHDIWCEILDQKSLSMNANFFRFGGNSLLITQLRNRYKTTNFKRPTTAESLNISLLLKHPTLSEHVSVLISTTSSLVADEEEKDKRKSLPKLIESKDINDRLKPFPVTEIQQAYLIGRSHHFYLGEVSMYSYSEFDCNLQLFDYKRFEQAFNRLIQRHETLRTRFLSETEQQILANTPFYEILILDLSDLEQNEDLLERKLNERRRTLSHQVRPANEWPLFDIQITQWKTGLRLHIGIDGLIMDAWSLSIFWNELNMLYNQPSIELPLLELSIRDYILSIQTMNELSIFQDDKSYWTQRLDTFPFGGPHLPLVCSPSNIKNQTFHRVSRTLNVAQWQNVQKSLINMQVTQISFLITLYAYILNKWSDDVTSENHQHFAINLPLFNRLPLHPQVNQILCDFTSILPLEIDSHIFQLENKFDVIVSKVQKQLWNDLDHTTYSGLEFIRQSARVSNTNTPIGLPVVFTSVLGMKQTMPTTAKENQFHAHIGTKPVFSISQTPQVWLDCQITESDLGELLIQWDYVADLFPSQMIESMHYGYCHLLEKFAHSFDKMWQQPLEISLPPEQLQRRYLFEQTEWKNDNQLLLPHLVLEQAKARPHSMAVISSRGNLTYEQLRHRSTTISAQIRQKLEASSQNKPHLCAIIMEKGWEQVVASLSTLMAGYAFLPLDVQWPIERLNMLIEESECQIILTQIGYEDLVAKLQFKDVEIIVIKDDQNNEQNERELTFNIQQTSDLAYVIYTSGSTGKPKGVCITHEAVLNTLLDINDRLNITSDDRILALSHLNFDLSIYDIFGILIAGGTMIIPSQQDYKNPEAWHQLILEHNITLWNSVPMLMQMYVEYLSSLLRCLNPLRHILLSGDWIPLSLPRQIFDLLGNALQLFSLGGASEASIWSIIYPIIENKIDQQWKSIPYGQPLRNQQYYILDSQLQPCPDYVCGDLYIGGKGLAIGYWKDKEKTKESFIEHPLTKQMIYRTGDLGRFIPTEDGGYIEFLGRKDFQVKIGGHRIELGEIEYHLQQYPTIQQAIIDITPEEVKNKQLVAYIVQKPVMDMNLDEDIIKDSIERANFKLQRHGLLENQDFIFSFNQCISLSKKELSEKDIETIDARKSYRQFFNEDQLITTNEIQQLLNTCSQLHNGNVSTHKLFDFNTLSDILQCLTTFTRIVDQPLPKYRYPSAGSLYPVQTYVEIHSLENIDSGIYYHHPDKHTLLKVVEIDRLSNEDQSIHLHLVGRHQAIAPLYGSKTAKEFCLLESGYIYGLLKEVCLNNNLQVSISEKKNDDKKVHKLLQLSDDDTLCSLTIQYASNQSTLPSISLLTICDLYVYFKETNQWFIYKEDSASLELCGTFQVNNVELSENGRIFDHCAVALYICGDKYDEKQELIEIGMISQLLMDKAIESPINIGVCPIGGGHPINHVNKLISSKIKNHRKHVLHTFLLGRVSSEQKKSHASSKVGNVNENQILTKYLKGKLPDYMIPNYYIMLEHLPLSSNGKIDRKQLRQSSFTVEMEELGSIEPVSELEKKVHAIWSQILKQNKISMNASFYVLGGNSLLLMKLFSFYQAIFDLSENTLQMTDLFHKSTLREHTQMLITYISSAKKESAVAERRLLLMRLEQDVENEIQNVNFMPGKYSQHQRNQAQCVLLTGATGFIGVHLLHQLLVQTDEQTIIYCLIRSSCDTDDRLLNGLKDYELYQEVESQIQRIKPLNGNLEEEKLGLSDKQWSELGSKLTVIYHCGALVNHLKDYDSHKLTNVNSTREVIRLSLLNNARINYISTPYVELKETHSDAFLEKQNGYYQSKWVAEMILQKQYQSLPFTIFRLGLILWNTKTGHFNKNDWFCRLFSGLIASGSDAPDANLTITFTPVDFISKSIIYLGQSSDLIGKIYSYKKQHSIAYKTIWRAICLHRQIIENYLDYDTWTKLVLEKIQNDENNNDLLNGLLYFRHMKKQYRFRNKTISNINNAEQDPNDYDGANIQHLSLNLFIRKLLETKKN